MKRSILALLALFTLLAINPVGANALTYYLDTFEIGKANNTGTAGPWVSVTLTDSSFEGKDSVHFVVDPIDDAFLDKGDNFSMDKFSFNENTAFGGSLLIGNFNPSGWDVDYDKNFGAGFGTFEFLTTGGGNSRANPLSFDVYTNAGTDLTITNFSTVLSTEGYLFAAHIGGYGDDESGKFATDGSTPVPEPGTMMLLGVGMFGLAVFGKRRMNK